MTPYSSLVLDHFERPRNQGLWPAAPDVIVGSAGSIQRGAQYTLSARLAGSTLQSLRFQAYGCPHVIASASWLTERVAGSSLLQLREWHWREAAEVLQVPVEKHGRLLVLEDAVRALVTDWQRKTDNDSVRAAFRP